MARTKKTLPKRTGQDLSKEQNTACFLLASEAARRPTLRRTPHKSTWETKPVFLKAFAFCAARVALGHYFL
jgi:hypothetical protein